MLLVRARRPGAGAAAASRRIGAPLLFGRLWQETGCRAVIEELLAGRGLRVPGRAGGLRHRAAPDHGLRLGPGLREVDGRLRHPRRGRPGAAPLLPRHGLAGRGTARRRSRPAPRPSPRARVKDLIEERAVRAAARPVQRALASCSWTPPRCPSTARAGETLGRAWPLQGPPPRADADDPGRGDRRRGPAGLLGDVARQHRRCLRPRCRSIDRLRSRFAIGRVCVVADRGMISAADHRRPRGAWAGIRARRARAHRQPGAPGRARGRAGPSRRSASRVPAASETQLWVKEVTVEGRRYIVCRNEAEADEGRRRPPGRRRRPRPAAEAGRQGADRQLRLPPLPAPAGTDDGKAEPAFEIDPGKLADEARFDGIFVLRTNARITPLQAVLRYRDLLQVEDLFRTAKALMRTRPIYHSSDAAIRGHVFCSFLALVLRKELDDRCRSGGLPARMGRRAARPRPAAGGRARQGRQDLAPAHRGHRGGRRRC